MEPFEPPKVLYHVESNRLAIATGGEGRFAWFIFQPRAGGHYSTGTRSPDDVSDWPAYTAPEIL